MLLVAGVLAFGVLAPPEHCPDVTADDLEASATAAVEWFTRNQHDDGTWLYEYDAVADRETGSPYNLVRHAGAVMGLYQAATAGIPGALESADRGVEWARDHLLEHDGWTALAFDGRTAVGAAALLAAGLVERRLLTGETDDDDLIRGLARFMVAQTEPSGAVLAQYDDAAGQPVPAATRSTTPARRTGRWPESTACSRTRAGVRPPTASATTWPPAATRSRTTGHRSRTTGRRTGSPRRSTSRSAIPTARSPRPSWRTPSAERPRQRPGAAGVLGGDDVRAGQRVAQSGRGVADIAHRGARQHEPAYLGPVTVAHAAEHTIGP